MQKSGEIKQSRWRILVQWKLVSRRRTAPWKAGKHKMHIIQGNNGKKTPWCFYIEMTSPLQRWLVSQWHISVKICPNVHQIQQPILKLEFSCILWTTWIVFGYNTISNWSKNSWKFDFKLVAGFEEQDMDKVHIFQEVPKDLKKKSQLFWPNNDGTSK